MKQPWISAGIGHDPFYCGQDSVTGYGRAADDIGIEILFCHDRFRDCLNRLCPAGFHRTAVLVHQHPADTRCFMIGFHYDIGDLLILDRHFQIDHVIVSEDGCIVGSVLHRIVFLVQKTRFIKAL